MNNLANERAAQPGQDAGHGREWPTFLLLAFLGLPVTMTLLIAAYGFVTWFLQILVFGPPS